MQLTRETQASKNNRASYSYRDSLGGSWVILCHQGRSWSARLGSHATTEWVAVNRNEVDQAGLPLRAASGVTLVSLKKRFQDYLDDRAAGCVRHKSYYGVL